MTKQIYNFVMINARLHRHQHLSYQIATLDKRVTRLQERGQKLSNGRLAIFVVGALLSAITLLRAGVWPWLGVTLLAVVAFAYSVVLHRRVTAVQHQLSIWRTMKAEQVARMDLEWASLPPALAITVASDHPFALDLDLVGERSLQRLLDTAVSLEGKERLRDWLLSTELDEPTIEVRRQRVRELGQMGRFGPKLGLKARLVSAAEWQARPLLDWLFAPNHSEALRPILWALAGAAVLNLTLAALYLFGRISLLWPVFSWFAYGLLLISQWNRTAPLFGEANFLADGLRRLQPMFDYLENYNYGRHDSIKQLCAPFWQEGNRPSHHLASVKRIIAAAGLRYNPFLGFILNFLVPWDVYFAYRLEQSKRQLQTIFPLWLDTWAELEALHSLANFAWLNPDYTWPDLVTAPHFVAQRLGHPLIPHDERVYNDYAVTELGTIALITGSNMAGKSSFLRTIGINLCLAYMGGPVVADSLQTTLFRVYSSIQIHDSLADGFSFFYAEVRRLQALLAAWRQEDERPLCFLIDEIFRGTNNRERLIGSRSYIRALAGGHGIGFIATHDLELVQLADELPGIQNFHFRDAVVNGRMVFDYKLHPGPCPTTNALKIMELAGLPVEIT